MDAVTTHVPITRELALAAKEAFRLAAVIAKRHPGACAPGSIARFNSLSLVMDDAIERLQWKQERRDNIHLVTDAPSVRERLAAGRRSPDLANRPW